jgi:hypothetical protein
MISIEIDQEKFALLLSEARTNPAKEREAASAFANMLAAGMCITAAAWANYATAWANILDNQAKEVEAAMEDQNA